MSAMSTVGVSDTLPGPEFTMGATVTDAGITFAVASEVVPVSLAG